ncbi:pyridoxamine 5'-phosphate oxidase family protein [Mycobacterium spongiae]|uniref:Pyridoxamine 5'-phosphate oxidase family protein n=1 Tax=Mycobacterium spongiae TaxID=886343 RepID=A0A975JZK4_9MYCO|nr:MSMEG_1061 family FMN-dependent PPOX-type flavoprotein [Mycobacterium spongiae]QUR67493.1 pyridoxamine 5'-phosphate oxidase family protein [Mycobacterium spongiae]
MLAPDDRFGGIDGIVTSDDELRSIIGTPTPQVIAKVTDRLDSICTEFIAKSPFCVVASSDPSGTIDLSPKGDPPGFVRVLDEHRLVIPDRPGNRRIDTFRNLMRDPRVGLIFIIPGRGETLRIAGEARVVRDAALLRSLQVKGKVPVLALVVYVVHAFMHCPKCMVRSGIWQPQQWPDSDDLADIGAAMIAHGKLDKTPEQMYEDAQRAGLTQLY